MTALSRLCTHSGDNLYSDGVGWIPLSRLFSLSGDNLYGSGEGR